MSKIYTLKANYNYRGKDRNFHELVKVDKVICEHKLDRSHLTWSIEETDSSNIEDNIYYQYGHLRGTCRGLRDALLELAGVFGKKVDDMKDNIEFNKNIIELFLKDLLVYIEEKYPELMEEPTARELFYRNAEDVVLH